MKIAFLGTGKIGLPLAQHIAAAGHSLVAFDIAPSALQAAREAGLATAPSLAGALDGASLVISSLPHDAAFEALAADVVRLAKRGTVYVDTSTVSPAASERVATRCAVAGVSYLRVTVSGNAVMAQAAQLTVMASGPRAIYDELLPVLSVWGPTRFWLGAGEQARLMKLVINLMIGVTVGGLAEALTLGRKGGLAWDDLWQVISASAVGSPIVKAKAPPLSRRDFTPTFTVPQMQKDVGLIMDAGAASGVALPITAIVADALTKADAAGDTAEDYATIIKVAERAAGLDTSKV